MVDARDTPSSVMYDDLHFFGGLSNKETARTLLSADIMLGGRPPRDRVDDRTYLSRQIVHVAPQDVNPAIFGNFYASTQTIHARIAKKVKGDHQALIDHYRGPAAADMAACLNYHGLDGQLYMNEVARLLQARLPAERDRSLLLVMLFCITGCLANPYEASSVVEGFAQQRLALNLATIAGVQQEGSDTRMAASFERLGLIRVIDNTVAPPLLPLNPSGSVIGALANGEGAITFVGPDVSRRHAKIWHDGTRWLCQGLGSTNGTYIISGADQSTIPVEPPRNQRRPQVTYPPKEIHEGDLIYCGTITCFKVLSVHSDFSR